MKLKKIFAVITVTFILLNNILPIMTYAVENTVQTETQEIGREYEIKDEETWDISKNGDGSVIAKWTFKDRTITISGSGEMKDWQSSSKEDWHNTKYTNVIENVVVENGITDIGAYAFYNCAKLKQIEMSNSVKSIEESAFYNCAELKQIEIPRSVTSIGNSAFYNCAELKQIEITNSVTSLENSAFENCSSLSSISISNSVTSIGSYAFNGCSKLKEIIVDENNSKYIGIDGVLYNKDKTRLIKYPAKKEATDYTIPNNVTSIGSCAFSGCSSLTNISISNGVTSIGSSAFSNCSNLTNIEMPDSVTSIEAWAFYKCSNLTSIKIPSTLTTIGTGVFEYCSSLINIEIPNSVTLIGSSAFNYCSSLTNINIPTSVISIELYAFSRCNGPIICATNSEAHRYAETEKIGYILTDNVASQYEKEYELKDEETWDISKKGDASVVAKWTLKDKTLTISGSGEMKDWTSSEEEDWHNTKYREVIQKVAIANKITNIGAYAFFCCKSLNDIEIASSVTNIGEWAFRDCSSLTNIDIPNSVTNIKEHAFGYCDNLKRIKIPSGVTRIKDRTFLGCSSLTNIEIPSSVTYIEDYAFCYCSSLTSIEIPNNVTSIDYEAFSNCSSLTSINIPVNVTSIAGGSIFLNCSNLKEINVDNKNKNYVSIDGVLYNKDKTEIIKYPDNKGDTCYIIPNSVIRINTWTFYGCSNLTNIEIPNSVTSIGSNAFSRCNSLISINIPNGVAIIPDNTFQYCNHLTSINIPNSVSNINKYAFNNCKGTIICKKSSKAHEFAENEKKAYMLDEEPPEVKFTPSDFSKPQKEVSIKVDITDYKSGVNESSLKYLWSTKDNITKDEITTSFVNGTEIKSPRGVIGTYYLYIYAEDKLENEQISKSNAVILDNIPPEIELIYSTKEPTLENVVVTITANEKVQSVEGWELSSDGLTLTKIYTQNTTEEVIVKDLVGNETKATVKVENIVKMGDIDNNNEINIMDILILLRHIAQSTNSEIAKEHPEWKLNEKQEKAGDVNHDNKVDIGDILKMLRYIACSRNEEIRVQHPEWLNL